MTISTTSGTTTDGLGQNVATANISGGIWNTRGGIRMAANSSSSAYLNISGTADIWIRDDLNMCNNATSCYAELNMSGGSLKIGDIGSFSGEKPDRWRPGDRRDEYVRWNGKRQQSAPHWQ